MSQYTILGMWSTNEHHILIHVSHCSGCFSAKNPVRTAEVAKIVDVDPDKAKADVKGSFVNFSCCTIDVHTFSAKYSCGTQNLRLSL